MEDHILLQDLELIPAFSESTEGEDRIQAWWSGETKGGFLKVVSPDLHLKDNTVG